MELAGRRDDAPPLADRQRRQPPRDKLVRVLPERDVIERVTKQPREARAHLCRLLCGAFPLVVDKLRRIQPRALLRLEAHVGPRLVRVAGQQDSLGDAEAGVVDGDDRSHGFRLPIYRLPATSFWSVNSAGAALGCQQALDALTNRSSCRTTWSLWSSNSLATVYRHSNDPRSIAARSAR